MDAAAARTDREEKLDNVYDEIETQLRLIGKKNEKTQPKTYTSAEHGFEMYPQFIFYRQLLQVSPQSKTSYRMPFLRPYLIC